MTTTAAELPAALNADAITAACEVLNAAVALPVEQYESNPALRPLRQAIGPLLARSLGRTYDGAGPQGKDKDAARKAHRRQANRLRQQAVAARVLPAAALAALPAIEEVYVDGNDFEGELETVAAGQVRVASKGSARRRGYDTGDLTAEQILALEMPKKFLAKDTDDAAMRERKKRNAKAFKASQRFARYEQQ